MQSNRFHLGQAALRRQHMRQQRPLATMMLVAPPAGLTVMPQGLLPLAAAPLPMSQLPARQAVAPYDADSLAGPMQGKHAGWMCWGVGCITWQRTAACMLAP